MLIDRLGINLRSRCCTTKCLMVLYLYNATCNKDLKKMTVSSLHVRPPKKIWITSKKII